jgi:hypothetical protein
LKQALLPCCRDLHSGVIDTLALARELFPGKRNSLDALCERFSVDNAQRTVHGALLDAQLLADVYLTMTRGQETLTIDMAPPPAVMLDPSGAAIDIGAARKTVGAVAPSSEELELHRQYLLVLEKESAGRCLWLALEAITGLDAAPRLAAAVRPGDGRGLPAEDPHREGLRRGGGIGARAGAGLSRRLSNTVLLKREDQQSVFSFKLRGATTRWRT